MDALFVKTASGLQKVEVGGEGGSVSRKVFTSSNRSAVLTAGTAFEVPEYEKDGNALSILLNGLLCTRGVEYVEVTTASISFTSDVPVDFEITAVVISGSGAGTQTIQTDESRDAVLTAGTAYAVPSAENRVSVFLDGVAYTGFHEVSQTTITFDDDIPAAMQIVVRVEA